MGLSGDCFLPLSIPTLPFKVREILFEVAYWAIRVSVCLGLNTVHPLKLWDGSAV